MVLYQKRTIMDSKKNVNDAANWERADLEGGCFLVSRITCSSMSSLDMECSLLYFPVRRAFSLLSHVTSKYALEKFVNDGGIYKDHIDPSIVRASTAKSKMPHYSTI
jgi:hypothetical protein